MESGICQPLSSGSEGITQNLKCKMRGCCRKKWRPRKENFWRGLNAYMGVRDTATYRNKDIKRVRKLATKENKPRPEERSDSPIESQRAWSNLPKSSIILAVRSLFKFTTNFENLEILENFSSSLLRAGLVIGWLNVLSSGDVYFSKLQFLVPEYPLLSIVVGLEFIWESRHHFHLHPPKNWRWNAHMSLIHCWFGTNLSSTQCFLLELSKTISLTDKFWMVMMVVPNTHSICIADVKLTDCRARELAVLLCASEFLLWMLGLSIFPRRPLGPRVIQSPCHDSYTTFLRRHVGP